MQLLKNILQDLRQKQNFDVYINISIAIVISVLGVAHIADQVIMSSAVLATLAIVSFSLLLNRRENEKIKEHLSKIDDKKHLADNFFKREYDPNKMVNLVRNSQEVYFFGTGFATFIPFLIEQLALDQHVKFKFLLTKPFGQSISIAAFRGNQKEEAANSQLLASLALLQQMAYDRNGYVEIKVIDYLPPYNIEAYFPNRYMNVRLTAFRTMTCERPSFELTQENDETWFNFFLEQFETLWDKAEPYASNG